MRQAEKPKVVVIGTGGTIAFNGRSKLDQYEYLDFGTIAPIEDLTCDILKISGEIDALPVRFGEYPSDVIGPTQWLELNALIHRTAQTQRDISGIVITHGTATLEETAYFLNLVAKIGVPIVLVGAQRPWNTFAADGPLNLLNAIRVAASPAAVGLGVTIAQDNGIWAARDVIKMSVTSSVPFQSLDLGMLGYVDIDARVVIYRQPTRRRAPNTAFDVLGKTSLPRVDIVNSYAGADGAAIDAFVAAGCKGIVVAGIAPGVPAEMQQGSMRAARQKGIAVALSMRSGSGRVLERSAMREIGVLTADNLSPQKARILLMLGLSITKDMNELQEFFYEY
jgi:L-asparaginase